MVIQKCEIDIFHLLSTHQPDYLQLENVLRKFKKPCLIDIKLGYRTYDEDASTLKISQEIAKYFYQKSIGFRLSGMKIYNHQTEKYEVYSRDWGRSISPSRMHTELCKFFLPSSHMTHGGSSDGRGCCGQCCSDRNSARNGSSDTGSVSPSSCQMMDEVARCRLDTFIDKIGQLLDIFQNDQDKFRFYACSILCVYEGDWTSVDTLHECEVKLIDFAHVFRIPTTSNGNGNGNGGGVGAATATDLKALLGKDDRRDQNTLFGLRSVLGYLLEIRTGMTTPRSPVDALVAERATNGNDGGGDPFASVVVKEREEELNETAAAAAADCKSSRCA